MIFKKYKEHGWAIQIGRLVFKYNKQYNYGSFAIHWGFKKEYRIV